MFSIALAKQEAKSWMKGSFWSQLFLPTLVTLVLSIVVSFVVNLIPFLGLFTWVFTAPILFGLIVSYAVFCNTKEISPTSPFVGFSNSKLFGASLLVTVIKFLWGLLITIPYFIVLFFISFSFLNATGMSSTLLSDPTMSETDLLSNSDLSDGSFILVFFILMLGTIIVSVGAYLLTVVYDFTEFVLLDNPEMRVYDAIKESVRISKGHRLRLLLFALSFFGWAVLTALSFGILSIYLTPYFYIARYSVYKQLTGQQNSENEEVLVENDSRTTDESE
ncbi:MAG: DUF975 family protein [Bacilli bacterium]